MLVSQGDEVKHCWRKIGMRVQQGKLIGAFELLLELCTSSQNHLPKKTWNLPVRRNIRQRNNFISLQPYANRFCNLSIRSPSVRKFLLRIQLNENVMKMWKSPGTRAAIMFQQKCVKFRESCNLLASPEALLYSLHKRNKTSFHKPHKLCRSIKSSFVIRLVVDMSMMMQG